MKKDSSDAALRAVLATAQADLAERALRAHPKASTATLSDVQAPLQKATKFVQGALAKSNTTRRGEKCGAMCVIGIITDAAAIAFESSTAFTKQKGCSFPVLVMWWITGLLTETIDHDLSFPEAVHMMVQQFTSVGYGSSTPMEPAGLKIFHGLHGVLSQMSVARVTSEAMNKVLALAGDTPFSLALALTITLGASILWFTSDLHSGDSATYPNWFDALLDGTYQALITMTTIGYGDLSLTTDAGKLLSPLGMPLLTNAFANFAGALSPGPDSTEESTDEGETVMEVCECFGKNYCKR